MSLAGVIVFGSVCEMILPGGVYKKYLHLAIGLMLILTLVSPFADGRVNRDMAALPEAFVEYTDNIDPEDRQNADIVRIYKRKLCEKMTDKIKGVAGVNFEIRCDISNDDSSFGNIENVWITVDAADGIKINDAAISTLKREYGLTDDRISVKYIKDKK